jgi:hypothetical protein
LVAVWVADVTHIPINIKYTYSVRYFTKTTILLAPTWGQDNAQQARLGNSLGDISARRGLDLGRSL